MNAALLSTSTDPEYGKHTEIVGRAGGSGQGFSELMNLNLKIRDLKKHVDWFNDTRPYLKKCEMRMLPHEIMLFLDYGGLNDSKNDKVSVWRATILAPSQQQEHFDYFFDQAGKKDEEGKAKKDGDTGKFFLDDMLDPSSDPTGNANVSLLETSYPDSSHLKLSGDTGNAYKA